MAPKGSAPPPVESSEAEETDSSSEEESEEEIAHSPPKKPSDREESESDDEEKEDEEESEEEIAHSPPKKPSDREESESDDEEKEDEEETDDEEEEEGKNDNEAEQQEQPAPKQDEEETDDEEEEEGRMTTRQSNRSLLQCRMRKCRMRRRLTMRKKKMRRMTTMQRNRRDLLQCRMRRRLTMRRKKRGGMTTEEEEGETDDEAEHQENPAPKKDEVEARSGKPQSSKDKKPAARIQQSWSNDDEVRILEAVAEHRRKHGKMPQSKELEAALADKLDRSDYGGKELMTKLHALKALYKRAVQRGKLPSKDLGARIFDLSEEIWGSSGIPANATLLRDVNELCEEYPYFAEDVKEAKSNNPGLFKRGFIEEEKARVLDVKIKKQRLSQVKLELRILDATKDVTEVLMNLM
ncbi:hypothetical protein PR202_gb27350 [Eleusine coracana subsp. coracana]|uniref:Glabrous enhancer-binding protein-like DBD domain-containing protein n=1 Tax=Eleusine coracana subsp. coracana TaxID=191504 RepID=A0AAV5FV37_ELECO|nr:hypothetical protein PR202_gb27350 [Eleusine coracana subsp. coracana]